MKITKIIGDKKLLQANLFVRAFGLTKVPMLFFLGPVVEELSDERVVIRIPLTRRVKNHVGSMYFGALLAASDLAGGIEAVNYVREKKYKMAPVFKDVKGEFLKRAEGDTLFVCDQVQHIRDTIDKAAISGERVNFPVDVVAYVPDKEGDKPVAKFRLTLSVKQKSKDKNA